MFEQKYELIITPKEFKDLINKSEGSYLEHLSNLYHFSDMPKFKKFLLNYDIESDLSDKVYYRENIPKNKKFADTFFYIEHKGEKIDSRPKYGEFYFKIKNNNDDNNIDYYVVCQSIISDLLTEEKRKNYEENYIKLTEKVLVSDYDN